MLVGPDSGSSTAPGNSAAPSWPSAPGQLTVNPDVLKQVAKAMEGDIKAVQSALNDIYSDGLVTSLDTGQWAAASGLGDATGNAYAGISNYMNDLITAHQAVADRINQSAQSYADAESNNVAAVHSVGGGSAPVGAGTQPSFPAPGSGRTGSSSSPVTGTPIARPAPAPGSGAGSGGGGLLSSVPTPPAGAGAGPATPGSGVPGPGMPGPGVPEPGGAPFLPGPLPAPAGNLGNSGPLPGEPAAGESFAGEPLAGEPGLGDPLIGGEPAFGEPVIGAPGAGFAGGGNAAALESETFGRPSLENGLGVIGAEDGAAAAEGQMLAGGPVAGVIGAPGDAAAAEGLAGEAAQDPGGAGFMPMGGAGGARREKERTRDTWLTGDSDIWTEDGALPPPVIGGRQAG